MKFLRVRGTQKVLGHCLLKSIIMDAIDLVRLGSSQRTKGKNKTVISALGVVHGPVECAAWHAVCTPSPTELGCSDIMSVFHKPTVLEDLLVSHSMV